MNTDLQTTLRGIANRAKREPKAKFGHLYTLLNEAMLIESFHALNRKAAAGVDGVTWREYESNLAANVADLVARLKKKSYKAKLVRRHYIPKAGGKLRPLGIPTIEDKMLQGAVTRILESIYEEDFFPFSWGYRPGRSALNASASVAGRISLGNYHWIVDADIKGFFDNIDHEWMIKMLAHRIDDKALLWLINKWLKAGILDQEAGQTISPERGTPQGGNISPILANIYLHYALDVWFEHRVRPATPGHATLVRYADDFVAAFQWQDQAERYLEHLRTRLGKFGLSLAAEKTKLVR